MSNIQLSEDSLEDLIYFSRAGDLSSLQTLLSDLSTSHAVSKTTILLNAIDADPADGTGSRNSLLHYPAANGNLEMIEYLLTTLGALSSPTSTGDATEAQTQNAEQPQLPKEVKAYISHPNLSSNTPLHWAALNGHMAVVKALVKAGADPTLVNAAGRDAVVEAEYSAKDGTDECATWLLGECGGLEKGVGGAGVGEGEAEDVEAELEDNGEGSSSVGNKQVNGA